MSNIIYTHTGRTSFGADTKSNYVFLLKTYYFPLLSKLSQFKKSAARTKQNRKYFMFIVPCITSLYQYVSNEMQQYAVYILFYCKITLDVSGAFHTHHQEYIKL